MNTAEEQRQADSLEYLRSYVLKHCHHMSPQQIADELQVPLFAVKLYYPNEAR
ncbi:hypothetical protein [Pseudomonas sp. MWU13-2100]|uniref:hypothetical protein n=1 Tax=Pseudomonas sp. MWU13-2100 TaxID=2935075 RepID=UPI002010A04E|nr:hypothetical protein [Pseudomonas sp. MWU13-2100]